jgi:hypothetical protein
MVSEIDNNWRSGRTRDFGCGLGWAIERGSDCISPACVNQGPFVSSNVAFKGTEHIIGA